MQMAATSHRHVSGRLGRVIRGSTGARDAFAGPNTPQRAPREADSSSLTGQEARSMQERYSLKFYSDV